MSKTDRFNEDYKKLEDLEKQVKQNLKEREKMVKAGQATGKYDYLLNSAMTNIQFELKNMDKLAYCYENEAHNYPELGAKELKKRVRKIEEQKEKLGDLQTQVKLILEAPSKQTGIQGDDLESRPLVRDNNGEFQDTKDLNNKQLLVKQKQMIQDQDQHLDQIAGIVSNIKYENENFQQEVTYQNKMLDKINTDVDRTHQKMVKVDSRLKELIAKSNQWCLWCVIILELTILIVIMIVL